MKVPYTEELTMGPATLVSHITDVKLDEKLAPKLFALPRAAKGGKRRPSAVEAAPTEKGY